MIKKLEVEDVAKLLIHDEIRPEDHFPGERGEIVQWLIQHIDNPGLFLWGALKDDSLTGMMLAISNVALPISNMVSILYFHTSYDFEINKKLVDELNKWAIEQGAKKVNFVCDEVRIFRKYGASQQAVVGGWEL